jgi:ChrB-like protein
MVTPTAGPGEWVLLTYRLPREPSTPRISVWRRLRRLGVAKLVDGLVALPADARTREQLDWVAVEIREAGGTAGVWLARPASAAAEREVAAGMARDRAGEYEKLREQAARALALPAGERARMLKRLRSQLRSIGRRDFFPPPQRDVAVTAVGELAALNAAAEPTQVAAVGPEELPS